MTDMAVYSNKCECGFGCMSEKLMNAHKNQYQCDKCKFACCSEQKLKEHEKSHTN